MLITKEIEIFNKIIPISELSLHSHKKIVVKCDNCDTIKEITYQSYNNSTNNNSTDYYCHNKECINKKRIISTREKYGVDNVSQLKMIKDKKIQTCLDNFGVKFPTQSDKVKSKSKNTNLEKYGVEWQTQSNNFKEKSKITNLERYGTESAMQSDIIKNKVKNTCLIKYDVDSYMKTYDFKNKSIITNLKNFGVKYPSQNNQIQDKIKKTNIIRYGVERPTQNEKIKIKIKNSYQYNFGVNNIKNVKNLKDKLQKTNLYRYNTDFYSQSEQYKKIVKNRKIILLSKKYNLKIEDIVDDNIVLVCDKCDNKFVATYQQLYNRFLYNTPLCTICNPIESLSYVETEFQEFISKNYNGKIFLNNRKIIKPNELDVYLPELNLAFEFNGLYWHSERYKDDNYHLIKTEMCEKLDIQLLHIWEDDWNFKKDIVKSIILNKLGKNSNKIYARKCKIKEISDTKLLRHFLDTNHIQGYINSKINIGLFYNDELFSLMTFGSKRKIMNSLSNDDEFEIYRFCNKLNTNIIGGASKLFSFFIKNYNFSKIISYSDRSYFNGNNYLKLGFKFYSNTSPNYYYTIKGKREYRFKFRKDILIKEGYDSNKTEQQIMLDRNIFRIYNSGNLKFIYEKRKSLC